MGLDRSDIYGIQFPEPVEFVLRRYAECGFPEAASDIATMLSDDFNEARLVILGAVVEPAAGEISWSFIAHLLISQRFLRQKPDVSP